MSTVSIGVIGVVAVLLLLALRMPVAGCLGLVGFVGFSYLVSPRGGFDILVKDLFYTFGSYTLSVIPAFVWMGYLSFHSGISEKLYAAAYRWVGHVAGGLAMATVAACAAFGAICGSGTATAGTMTSVALPEMKKYHYSPQLATGTIASSAMIGVLIPPSIPLIIYGIATEVSIGTLFISSILPGLLLALLFAAVIYIQAKRNPKLGPPGPRRSLRDKLLAIRGGVWETLFVFTVVMGGLMVGLFTPTEAGALGAMAVLVLALSTSKLSRKALVRSLADTTRTTAMILLIVAGAFVFGRFITVSRIPSELAVWVSELPLPGFATMAIIYLMYFILGMFMDFMAIILLTVPIFVPIIETLGYDAVWFGVIITLLGGMGCITPPVGINVYVVSGVAEDIPLGTIFKGVWFFLVAIAVCIIILMMAPEIVLFLPSIMGY